MLQKRLKIDVIKSCHSPYQNPWYLVNKTSFRKYCLVNFTVKFNQITIQDSNLPSSLDKFSEKFSSCTISSLIDFFSGYYQVELDKKSQDPIKFMIPLGFI